MTDDFEQQVSEILHNRVADLPASFEVDPATLTRVRRRRATKVGALATALVLVVTGTAAAAARAVDRDDGSRVLTTQLPEGQVPTVACPVSRDGSKVPTSPSLDPRVPYVDDAAEVSRLASYAAFDDPRVVVLGPEGWQCNASMAPGSRRGQVNISPRGPFVDHSSIFVMNDYLWHGLLGSRLACSVSNDPTVHEYVREHSGTPIVPCEPDRVITRVSDRVSTFRDPVGRVGASWLALPSSDTGDDGSISFIMCTPTEGLSAEECDAVVADWIARVDRMSTPPTTAAPTTSTTIPVGSVPLFGCLDSPMEGQVPPGGIVATPGVGDPALYPGLASFSSDVDGSAFNAVLGPRSWTCRLVDPDTKPTITVFDPAKGGGREGREAPILLDVHLLWGDRNDAVAACAVFDDPAIQAYVTPRFSIQCPETSGLAVTRVGSHAATFVDPEGTRGAAWYGLPSSDDADDGRLFVLSCRPTESLTAEQCDTITADYAARADAWVEPR